MGLVNVQRRLKLYYGRESADLQGMMIDSKPSQGTAITFEIPNNGDIPMSLGNKMILVVDDEPRTRQGIKQTLEVWAAGRYTVETADNGIEARERLLRGRVHLLITDVRMPEVSGLDLIRSLEGQTRKPVVIVISGYAEFEYVQQALQLGAVNYLLKPLDKGELLQVVEAALKREEEEQRREKLEKLVDHKLLEMDPERSGMGEPVKEALVYVEQHLQEQLGMAEVAGLIHLNASYFSVLFKEQTGFPSANMCRG